jgi:N-acetylglucosamine kinase-like BadF-type ATPase
MSKLELSPTHDAHFINDYSTNLAATGGDRFYLGIDGGASKTHAVITDASFRLISEGHGGPSNPARVGVDEAIASIVDAISEACAGAGLLLNQITSSCAALAGVGDVAHYEPMKVALDREFGIGTVELVTDALAALEGALDGHPGVVVIAGTGSIAMGVSESGEQARSGGWGPTLGDEGSGYDIARQALKAVAASFDGRAPRTLLTDLICVRLQIKTAADLPSAIYSGDFEHAEIASLAELVCEAAQEGDEVAGSILAEAGANLGELAVSVIEKLRLDGSSFRVACVGSVFHSGDVVIKPLMEAVLKVAPRAEVGPPLYSPAMGAARLARRADEAFARPR